MPITLVMPTYNGGDYLKDAISSLLRQHYQDWELLISDDGSNDGTRNYLEGLTDPRIKVFFQDKNLGIFGNLNFLFGHVKTDLVQILCQDDWLTDEKSLSACVDEWAKLPPDVMFLRSNHGCDVSAEDLGAFEVAWMPRIVEPGMSDVYFFLFGCIPGNLSNVSLRTRTVRDEGWFDQRLPYAGDFEFWSRVGSRMRWATSGARVTTIRTHDMQASKTLNKAGELMPQLSSVVGVLFARLQNRGLADWKLRVAGEIIYVSQHRWRGLRARAKTGSWTYMREANRHLGRAPWALGGTVGWLVFVLTCGGRIFKKSAIAAVLRPIHPPIKHRDPQEV